MMQLDRKTKILKRILDKNKKMKENSKKFVIERKRMHTLLMVELVAQAEAKIQDASALCCKEIALKWSLF